MSRKLINKIGKYSGSACLCLLILISIPLPALAAPVEIEPSISSSLAKNSYWYKPGSTALLDLTVVNNTKTTLKNISVRIKVHSQNKNRADLDSFLKGKPVKSYRINQTVKKNATLKPGRNVFRLEFIIPSTWSTNGVYPLSAETIKSDKVEATALTQLIVMSGFDQNQQTPLKVATLFDVSDRAYRNPEGFFINTDLAKDCTPDGKDSGWIASLLNTLSKEEKFRGTLAISPLLLKEMEDMSNGFTVEKDKKKKEYDSDSKEASATSDAITKMAALAKNPRLQFCALPYAYPDLEELVGMGLTEDATSQIKKGRDAYKKILGTNAKTETFIPPLLKINSKAAGELNGDIGEFLLLTPQLLNRSKKGQKLAEGLTLGSPVAIDTDHSETEPIAIFSDLRIEDLIVGLSSSTDPQLVAQVILAELTNLYLERPAKLRVCAIYWPNWWQPSKEVLDEVIKAISTVPWLQTSTLSDCFNSVPPLENVSLEIPELTTEEKNSYYSGIKKASRAVNDYSEIIFRDNPIMPILQEDLSISESAIWTEFNIEKEGRKYSDYLNSTIEGELAKIAIPETGTITLTSGRGEIPVSVINNTGYRVKTVLKFKSNGLIFPDGQRKSATLEPKENLFEIPVKAEKGGRVNLSATLEGENFIIDNVTFSVITSTFNTFAIFFVSALLGLIGLTWIIKIYAKRSVGKHKKRQLKESGQGNDQ